MKVIYLGHDYPYPDNNGGQRGILANSKECLPLIKDLSGKYIYVIVNEREILPMPDEFSGYYMTIKGKFAYKGFIDKLDKLRNTFLSVYPRAFERTCTKSLLKTIKELEPECIIVDGINFFPLVEKIHKKTKVIYIANNVETDLQKDICLTNKGFTKFCYYLQYLKMKHCESKLFEYADKIICLSTSDFGIISKLQKEKTYLCPHNIPTQNEQRQIREKSLLFAGSISFPPNRDAIRYICETLAKKMPKVKFYITGTSSKDVPNDWKNDNVEFLGFVPKEKLINLYLTAGGFICPIIYGSGIKMKILESLQYYMPVFATEESLNGLKFIDIPAYIDRNNINTTINNIEGILFNEEKYYEYINDIEIKVKKYQDERKDKLLKLISSFI